MDMADDPPHPTPQSAIGHVIIYTDGAAEPNPGPGGYGVVLLSGKHRKELSGGFRRTTNNRMELLAVIVGLESLTKPCRVTLYSDSKYVVDSVERGSVLKWSKNNWYRTKTDKAKNADLWARFLAIYAKHEVRFKWVRGHTGVPENERCDVLAVAAAQAYDSPHDTGYLKEIGEPTDSLVESGIPRKGQTESESATTQQTKPPASDITHKDAGERLNVMFQNALGRRATTEELQRWTAVVREMAADEGVSETQLMTSPVVWKAMAHALFNVKEFIYVR